MNPSCPDCESLLNLQIALSDYVGPNGQHCQDELYYYECNNCFKEWTYAREDAGQLKLSEFVI